MKKTNLLKTSLCILLLTLLLTACGNSNSRSSDSIIGTWVSNYSAIDIVVFEEDGSCSAPFTYSGSWCESASQYVIKDDKTLVLSSKDGHAGGSYEKAETEEEALEDKDMYYVSKDTLIIDGDTYSFTPYSNDSIIGTWVSEHNDIVVFKEDGSCSAPFTYNGSWWESANRYAIKADETLVLCSKDGHAGGSYEKAETEEEALEDKDMYYVSKKILIIDGDTYSKE